MHPFRWLCSADPTTYFCQALGPGNFADLLQAFFALCGLVGLWFGFRFTRQSLNEIRRQNDTLERQLAFTDRAWVKVSPRIPRGFQCIQDVVRLTVRVDIENVGRSVAVDVDAFAKLRLVPVRGSILHDVNQHLADLIAGERSSAKASREISFADTVFPGGKTTIEWTLPVEETDIALQQYTPAGSMPSVSFYLLGCASYRLTNHAEPRISTFGYDLGWSPGDGAPESNRFEIDALRSNLLEGSITLSPIPGTFKAD